MRWRCSSVAPHTCRMSAPVAGNSACVRLETELGRTFPIHKIRTLIPVYNVLRTSRPPHLIAGTRSINNFPYACQASS